MTLSSMEYAAKTPSISLSMLTHYITTQPHTSGIPEEYRVLFSAELLKWQPGYILHKLQDNLIMPNVIVHQDKIYVPVFIKPRGQLVAAAQTKSGGLWNVSFRVPRKDTGIHNYVLIGTEF